MQKDIVYDIVVLGASAEGIALCEKALKRRPDAKIALVCKKAPKKAPQGVDVIEKESMFSSYVRGLFGFTLKDKTSVFGTAAVIATGSAPVKSQLKTKSAYYKPSDITEPSKNRQAAVCGEDQQAVDYALALSKKFRYVYLCSPTGSISCTKKSLDRLEGCENVVVLRNSQIIGCKNDKDGYLTEVSLNTYDTLHCSAIIFSLGRGPDVSGISKKLVELDEYGRIKVGKFNETTKVPKLYAIGACCNKSSKQSAKAICESIFG